MLTYEIARIQCSIELSEAQWNKLQELDYLDVVNPALVEAGAWSGTVEYEGHSGMFLYFTADNPTDAEKVARKLEELLGL